MSRKLLTAAMIALLFGIASCKKGDAPGKLIYSDDHASICRIGEFLTKKKIIPSQAGESVESKLKFTAAEASGADLANIVEDNNLTVFYRTNSWTLHRNDWRDLVNYIKNFSAGTSFIVEGHCDERGTDEYNFELGNNRAQGVADILEQRGYKVSVVSHGEAKPVDGNHDEKAWQKNRRIVLVPSEAVLWRGLDVLQSDAYLLDGSGSMQELAAIDDTKVFHIKKVDIDMNSRDELRLTAEGYR